MPIDARSVLLYEVYPQLEALGVDGVARLLGAFSNIEAEAEKVTNDAFEAYGRLAGEGDMSDFVDSATDQGIAYYQSLAQLKQGVTNLLGAGLYHLFEQHLARIKAIASHDGQALPDIATLKAWPKVNELRLLANTIKHAEGPSAVQLRAIHPDYFVDPVIRGSTLEKWQLRRGDPVTNPLGGTDLFVSPKDLSEYYDAIRALWEELVPHL
jgi:hypothetical protein